jgi:hypothetical protein
MSVVSTNSAAELAARYFEGRDGTKLAYREMWQGR